MKYIKLFEDINKSKPKVIIFQGSPRDKDTCPNMESKTHTIVEYVVDKYSDIYNFDVIDLSVNQSKKSIIQPCKGCVSTAGGYHCIAKGERVETKYGFKKIEDIQIGDELSTGVVENAWMSGKDSDVFEVIVSDGRKIKLTDNHPIKIINPIYKNGNKRKLIGYEEKWKNVKDIKIGDRLPFNFNENFINDDNNINVYHIAGMIWGDGSYKSGKLRLCYDIRDEKLFNFISSNFEISVSQGPISKNTTTNWISFKDRNINISLNTLIKSEKIKNIHSRRIPDIIMNSSKIQISKFLNGWFATDGSVILRNNNGNKYYEINLTSVSKDSLRDCQMLLSKFGIKSSISYLDHIETFRFNKFIKRSSMLIISGKNANIFMREIGIINKDYKFEYIKYRNSKKHTSFGKIESIESIETSDVYDISVSDSHKFICEGIEVHNCHWYCTCYKKNDEKKPDFMYDGDIYTKLEKCDAFLVFSPIHWYSVSSQVKALFDRLVCASQTLHYDDAIKVLGKGNLKNSEITGKFAQSGEYNDLLKNHLEGKVAGFYVHGDDGANDYDGKDFPKSFKDENFTPKQAIIPIVNQCRYSGINVPNDLIEAFYINKGKDYYTSNLDLENLSKPFDNADRLLENLKKYI